jgi:hypothetical protein
LASTAFDLKWQSGLTMSIILYVEQALYYNTGLIPSRYVEVMVDKDRSGFQQVLITSVIVIISTSLVIYTMTTE